MKFKYFILLLAIATLSFFTKIAAQEKANRTLVILDSFFVSPINVQFSIDNSQNIYLIKNTNELVKQDYKGTFIGNFREKVLGRIGYIDCTNPLLLTVFYPEAATLVQLDNMLNVTNKIIFQDLLLGDALVFCRSYDNNFWIYDERNFRVKKVALDLKIVAEGEWLTNRLRFKIKPTRLEEKGDYLLMHLPDTGIVVLNRYGMFKKFIPIKSKSFTVVGSQIYALQADKIKIIDLNNPLFDAEIQYKGEPFIQIESVNQKIYLLRENAVVRIEN